MSIPLPPRVAECFTLQEPPNPSLLFDRGGPSYRAETAAKALWLADFARCFNKYRNPDYEHWSTRRTDLLVEPFANSLVLASSSRLVIGLGIAHWTEAALLLDRLTGSPYVPGSSVKGLLRATARVIASEELPVPPEMVEYWKGRIDKVFGRTASDPAGPSKGNAVFFDAFPLTWPTLVPEIMTVHFGEYYKAVMGGTTLPPPGDWENPNPVTFLAVEAGTRFRFSFRCLGADQADDLDAELGKLILVALDWFGAGGKTSSGFGRFCEPTRAPAEAESRVAVARAPVEKKPDPIAPTPLPAPPPQTMRDQGLDLQGGKIVVYSNKVIFARYDGDARKDFGTIFDALRKGKRVIASLVVEGPASNRRITEIKDFRIK